MVALLTGQPRADAREELLPQPSQRGDQRRGKVVPVEPVHVRRPSRLTLDMPCSTRRASARRAPSLLTRAIRANSRPENARSALARIWRRSPSMAAVITLIEWVNCMAVITSQCLLHQATVYFFRRQSPEGV